MNILLGQNTFTSLCKQQLTKHFYFVLVFDYFQVSHSHNQQNFSLLLKIPVFMFSTIHNSQIININYNRKWYFCSLCACLDTLSIPHTSWINKFVIQTSDIIWCSNWCPPKLSTVMAFRFNQVCSTPFFYYTTAKFSMYH